MGELSPELNSGKLPPLKTITEVEPIWESGRELRQRTDIRKLVEEPLVQACERLYDMNIQTLMSSANPGDLGQGYGYIDLDYESLSNDNKSIAQKLIQEQKAILIKQVRGNSDIDAVKLKIPLNENSTVIEVSEVALSLVNRFVKQNMSWVVKHPLDDIGKEYYDQELDKKTPEELERILHLYYDSDTRQFFYSRKQCIKAKEEL